MKLDDNENNSIRKKNQIFLSGEEEFVMLQSLYNWRTL